MVLNALPNSILLLSPPLILDIISDMEEGKGRPFFLSLLGAKTDV